MTKETVSMIKGWLEMHNGDVEGLARWMSVSVRLGSRAACRRLIRQATNAP